jgi:hypothetical protein
MATVSLANEEDAITAAVTAYLRAYGAADPRAVARVVIAALDAYHGKITAAVDSVHSIGSAAVKTTGNQRA